ncbi:hypothetical protein CALCODRAFT_147703 [Calocera cornea HHB12733]|uniref:FAS1 domain-containing protein n=1 Tax=Calocera cornea HHB12733 TaxID=1353952 RepID=A0A165CR28_9BASI|nr:hypothetical protein CALCODRAFT_147703 [Calocera cornea HHB12733]
MRILLSTFTTALSIAALCEAQTKHILMTDQSHMDVYAPITTSEPTLADLLTVHTIGSIWYDYAREVEPISLRLSDTSPSSKSTLFVPVNKAIMALHRKPHEGPAGDDVEITDDKAKVNVERWVSAHIVPTAPLDMATERAYPTLLDGHDVFFKRTTETGEEWQQYTLNANICIVSKAPASNGDIYFIDGVLDV